MATNQVLLGDFSIQPYSFPGVKELINSLDQSLSKHLLFQQVNSKLLDLIQKAPNHIFLLPAVIEFLDHINKEALFDEKMTFALFEFWLNHFSGVDNKTNLLIRGKIAGKTLPRDAYQAFFPIGMGKVFPNTHFVTSHLSPDVDTMIASYWGWVDAFAARVCNGLHFWCLPGGAPESPVTTLFLQLFGKGTLDVLPRTTSTLTLSAIDLVTHSNLSRKHGAVNISSLDHGINERAVIVVDEAGQYVGDWRSSDVELVRQVIILFKAILRWFENNIHAQLIILFAKENLNTSDINYFLQQAFHLPIEKCETAQEFSDAQFKYLEAFFQKILNIKQGLSATFSDLNQALEKQGVLSLKRFQQELEKLAASNLFDKSGTLKENRPEIFNYLEQITNRLNEAIHEVRNYSERLDVSMQIKELVLNLKSESIQLKTDVDVIRQKMQNFDYLTITITEKNGSQYPVGVVWAKDLRQTILGTVSFRDFCNFDEVKMASYLSVISVVDHHKAWLKTNSPPLAILGDVQSCNVLVAEISMRLNDEYSLLGLSPNEILPKENGSSKLMERIIRRQTAVKRADQYYVDPVREYAEYLCFLHAILDDTDLLNKVTARDVICIAELLNRLKSLQLKQDVEIITLDDIPEDGLFAKTSAKRILRNEDMYSIYKKSFAFREKEVEQNLKLCIEGAPNNLFSDVKVQNGSCRISQTKLFSTNIPLYLKHAEEIQQKWAAMAQDINNIHSELDLHLHMMSTIPSAEEVHSNKTESYSHQDELWFWIPQTELALNRLANFLGNFQQAPEIKQNELSLIVYNDEVEDVFKRYFLPIEKITKGNKQNDIAQPVAILRFRVGSLNSRKAMISPYLPRSAI